MKLKKYILGAALFLGICMHSAVFAKEAVFTTEDYDIKAYFNETACPGDAVFVRLTFSQNNKKAKTEKARLDATTATLELYLGDQRLRKSEFYQIPADSSSSKGVLTLLSGIPLSSWWTKDNNFHLKVKYRIFGEKNLEFDLPFALTDKTFVSETIPLNQQNTSIKTDTSTTRMAQINKLNAILETINATAVYQTTPYTPPTDATRRTSFFADRRVYTYTNGKSSTSLHYGIDYGVPTGSTVSACADGKVVLAEWRNSTGWSVVIEHLPGLYSLYYHMSELTVKENDTVKAGTLVGLSGATGLATGPHLHWEMRLNMEAVSPDFFTGDFTFSVASKAD